jgi:uncharacterized phage protein gp47/JayE
VSGTVTFPLPTLAAQITPTGITAPTLDQIISSLQASYAQIYGTDNIFDPSTQDTQWIAIQAQAIYDCNLTAIAVYNQFSPATAVGAGLSSVVKINGLERESSSFSTADVTLVATAGLIIDAGQIGDNLNLGTVWDLSPTVTITPDGTLTTTATCTTAGSISVGAGVLDQILTPTAGWDSVTNGSNSSPGAPVELDAELRQRQAVSTDLPAQTPFDAIVGALRNVAGVTAVGGYVNNTSTTDVNGVPPHGIALVVQGGAVQDVVNVIGLKKTPGPPTFGTTSGTYVSPFGIPETINFSIPTQETITTVTTLEPLTGFTSAISAEIQNAIATYINSLGLTLGLTTGNNVRITRLYAPALLQWSGSLPANPNDPNTFEITSIAAAISPATPGTTDVTIAWNQMPVAVVSGQTIVT